MMQPLMPSSMYLLNRQIHPPTAVDHSIYCHFYSNHKKNLLVAVNNILKVYRIIAEEPGDKDADIQEVKGKLECQQTFSLFGKIAAIEAVTFSGSQRDSVLICLPEGKISVVEYDPTTHDLKTMSLHYFEDDEMREGFAQSAIPPIIRVDPDGRCAAFLVYGRNIVILPFRKEAVISDDQHQQIGVSTITAAPSSSVKTPVLSSYKLNLNDDLYAGEKIQNMIDMAFLEGYNEPTLCLLHEPIKTWSGRLAVRMDTCSMAALSLNIQQRVHPIIWSVNNLPYDCFKIMPVPKPVSGILIFSVNALIYLNQSVPPFGISLNGFADSSTAFPLVPQKGIKISMDASRSCFISNDKLLVSLKGGDLYVLTLFNDSMRSIRKFHFQKAASSVLTTCITKCDGPYVFLGSRVGNSLLLKYNEKPYDPQAVADVVPVEEGQGDEQPDQDITPVPQENGVAPERTDVNGIKREHSSSDDDEEPITKQIKKEPEETDDNIGDWMAKDYKLISADDFEVYGEVQDEVEKLPTSFSFEVCDSISNIAPCSKICMGEPAFLADEFSDTTVPQVELVTSSGFRKNGALSLLQRTIRPQVVTTLQLTDSIDVWTVFSPSHSLEYHSFIVISKNDSTIIFQAGAEINELDQSGFSTQTRTILAANIGQNKFVIQVTPNGARLLEGSKQIQYLPIDIFGSPIVFATASDPYVLLLTEQGAAAQIFFNENTQRLIASKPKLSLSKSKIITCCIYKDVSGFFTTESK
jgi:cleavage and polyadenylation specificity factor subunit 1